MAFADSANVQEATYQLRAYFVPWEELRRKQGTLTASQLQAVNSGITSGFVALIAQNAADINTLRGLVTAQIRLRKVTALPDEGEANVFYLVPDVGADPTSPDQCTEYIWADNRYEIVGKTSVTPGNGTLTINVNGQPAGSFSADQSTDTTIGITVPLAVSDLQNDSGFQTASDVAAAVAALSAQLAAVAFSGSYDDLTDKPSYPGIGNGTLTIAQNGLQVGSFTANQDTASTINIVTPTKTSDLQNDSGFVDSDDLETKQDELSEAQLAAVNSGITDTAVAQIEVNRVAIQGKQTQLTQTQLNAVNSGITSGKVALFDAHLADTDAHVTAAQKAAWTAKQDALTEAQLAAVNSGVTAQKVTGYDDHVADADIHVTAAQKAAWTAKQDALTEAQQAAVNSGITSALVTQIGTNQDDIATKAADSEVVHLAGAETITGDKTHAGILAMTGNNLFAWDRPQVTMGTLPSSTVYYGTTRYRDAAQATFCLQRGSVATTGTTTMNWYVYAWNDASIYRGFTLSISADGTAAQLKPLNNAAIDLGTSANKWKSLNGINPGALGMPNVSSVIDISGNITDFSGTAIDLSSVITVPGWINIVIPNVTGDYIMAGIGRSGGATAFNSSQYVVGHSVRQTTFSLLVPVPPGASVSVQVKVTGGAVTWARFYPCLGNV